MTTISLLLLLQSLWSDGGQDPFDAPKRKPFKLHDHVKIIVNDRAVAQVRSTLRSDKRTRWETDFADFIRFDVSSKGNRRLRAAELADDPSIDIDARFRQDDLGRTGRNFNLAFNITSEVIDIQPNGNLVIQATRRRKVNEEIEMIKLTGIVSPNAVGEGNIIHSDDVANLDLSYSGSGSVSDVTKPGFIGWLLQKLWPF